MTFPQRFAAESEERIVLSHGETPTVRICTTQFLRTPDGVGARELLSNESRERVYPDQVFLTANKGAIVFTDRPDLVSKQAVTGVVYDENTNLSPGAARGMTTGTGSGLPFGYLLGIEMISRRGVLGSDAIVSDEGGLTRIETDSESGHFTGWFDERVGWLPVRFQLRARDNDTIYGTTIKDLGADEILLLGEIDVTDLWQIQGRNFIKEWTLETIEVSKGVQKKKSLVSGVLKQLDLSTSENDLLLGLNVPDGTRLRQVNAGQIEYEWNGKWATVVAAAPNPTALRTNPTRSYASYIWVGMTCVSAAIVVIWAWRRLRTESHE